MVRTSPGRSSARWPIRPVRPSRAPAISVRNVDTGAMAQTTTDASGSYSIPNLLAGTYEMTVRRPGFQTLTVTALQLLSAQTLRQDMKLEVGAVQQTVEVAGQALLIRTDSQTIGSSLGSRQVADLPLAGTVDRRSARNGARRRDHRRQPAYFRKLLLGRRQFHFERDQCQRFGEQPRIGHFRAYPVSAKRTCRRPIRFRNSRSRAAIRTPNIRNVASVMMVIKQGTNEFHGLGLRIPAKHGSECEHAAAERHRAAASAFSPEPVRRGYWRPHRQEPAVCLWRISRHSKPVSSRP